MICTRCKAENETIRKFCKSCGAPMGIICDRCGTVNRFEDRYCGACGFALVASVKSELAAQVPKTVSPHTSSRQYSAQEIDELLSLRRSMKEKEPTTKVLNQNDIDDLFK